MHRHRGKGSVKTGQRRAAWPHDGECLESAEAGRGEDRVSPGAFRGHAQNSGPQNSKRMHFLLSEAIKLVEICSAASGLVLPRAADQGSVRAGWQLLGCKTKAGPLIMGTSEETLNEGGRREVTGVHSFRHFLSCQPFQLILPTPHTSSGPKAKLQEPGGGVPEGGSSPLFVMALPAAKVKADYRAPDPPFSAFSP